jgi:hypothetical protein
MPLQISPFGNTQFFDVNGNPANGYQLFTYGARTSTKQTTYSDLNGVGMQTNPIILNTNGLPTSPIYIDSALSYKFVLALPTDTDPPTAPLYTVDQVTLGLQLPTTVTAEWVTGATPSYVSATQFSVTGTHLDIYHIGRRVKLIINSGTLYGTISNSVFGGGVTTVTVALDTGTLNNTLSAHYYGFLSASGSSWPGGYNTGLTTTLNGNLVVPITAAFNLLQAGSILPFAGTTTPPAGYLKCDGASYDRTAQAPLFGAIGTTFGAVDGSHFNVPTIANLAANVGYIIRSA